MKATELRIGNWIEAIYEHEIDRGDGVIEDVESSEVVQFIGYDPFDNHIWVDGGSQDKYHEFRPIPLTKEWLVRLKNDGSFKLIFIKSIAAFEVQRKYVGIESGEEWIFISNVRYVHEWQNLYHALTGEELELKP